MSSDVAIVAAGLGKCFQIYDKPQDRLKQTLLRGRRQFYREFWALRDISLEVRKGETVGVIGRNGSGKSTLLQLIAGTLSPTTGSVDIDGRVAALLELGAGFNRDFTGRENVFVNGAILGIPRAEMERRFDAIAAFADIGDFIDQPIKTYSSGMVVRLAFAVSINVDPEILIVDEALAVGDAAFQFKCHERLDVLTRKGVTLLFVSHNMEMVRTFCNRVVYLEGGQVKAIGSPEDMAERYFFDLRVAQQRYLGTGSTVSWKAPLYGSGQAAFGTEDGRIAGASFVDGGGQAASYEAGEEVAIVVDAEYKASVGGPQLCVLLQDRKMVTVGGRAVALTGSPDPDGIVRTRVQCSFAARLGRGRYFITLRLEDHRTAGVSLPLDKQSGVMSFEVYRPQRDVLGSVDLGMRFAQVPAP